jgi:hypothetical protein
MSLFLSTQEWDSALAHQQTKTILQDLLSIL